MKQLFATDSPRESGEPVALRSRDLLGTADGKDIFHMKEVLPETTPVLQISQRSARWYQAATLGERLHTLKTAGTPQPGVQVENENATQRYALLRLADPERVPSILVLDPPKRVDQ